jgi:hypothetical protein
MRGNRMDSKTRKERQALQSEQRIVKLNRTISELAALFDEKFVELSIIFQKRQRAIKQRDELITNQRRHVDLMDEVEEKVLTNLPQPADEADSSSIKPLSGTI